MKKAAFVKVVGCVLAVLLVGVGCAGTSQPPPDEELIASTLDTWKTALIAKDVDAALSTFSANFSHYEVADKATMTEMLAQAYEMGMGDDMAIDLGGAETVIVGDQATVGPVELTTVSGSLTGDVILGKEDGAWLITTLDVSGY